MKRLFWFLAALIVAGPAYAQSQLLLGAGKQSAAAPADCSAFLPAAFNSSSLYISWTTADGLGGFGKACLNGTTPVAASTLGTISGSGSAGATGLVLTGGFFQFSNVTWLSTGTLYVNLSLSAISGVRNFFTISDGTTANSQNIFSSGGAIRGTVVVGGSTVASVAAPALTVAISTVYKVAWSSASGAQILCVNGGHDATASGAGTLTGLNASNVGANAAGASPTAGTITETALFSTALASTAACDTLTTP